MPRQRRNVISMSGKQKEAAGALRAFFIELVVYGVLVVAYFFVVLMFLQERLHQLALHHIRVYAVVAILLILGQAVLLESVTTGLMRLIRGRSE